MRLCVVSVFDSAAQAFGRPVFVAAPGQALRSFQDEVNKGEGDLSKHPEDFTLYQLGWFDDNSGQFDTDSPAVLMRGKDAITKES